MGSGKGSSCSSDATKGFSFNRSYLVEVEVRLFFKKIKKQ